MEFIEKISRFVKTHKLYCLYVIKLAAMVKIAQHTEFVPDEHWQSTEVAYKYSFGRGHLTWEWWTALRSVFVPSIISNIYWVGIKLDIVTPYFLTFWPQLLVGIMTICSSHCFYLYAKHVTNQRAADIAIFLLTVNWFTTFCGARVLANQIEMNLTCICLYLLIRPGFIAFKWFAILMAINFMSRPTMGIFWVTYGLEIIAKFLFSELDMVVMATFFGISTAGLMAFLDSIWFGRYVVTPWNFLVFNVLDRGNAEFGSHPRFWYFYNAFPSIFGPLTVSLILAVRSTPKALMLLFKALIYVAIYSYLDHKEIRFLLPIVPIVCLIYGETFAEMESLVDGIDAIRGANWTVRPTLVKRGFVIMVTLLHLAGTIFFGFEHQEGIRPAGRFVHKGMEAFEFPRTWFIMPCYSSPVHTMLHNPQADFKYYVCAPQRYHKFLNKDRLEDNFIQGNGFSSVDILRDVDHKLNQSFPPHFVITYSDMATTVQFAFKKEGYFYAECGRYRHTYVGDGFYRFVVVLCATPLNLHGGRLGGYIKGS